MMEKKEYSILLQKGLSMFNESVILLRLWQPGFSTKQLTEVALKNDALGRSTEYRIADIVYRIFFRRYVGSDSQPAISLKYLVENDFNQIKLQQLMMIYICRSDVTLFDFIRDVYWPRVYTGLETIAKEDSLNFLYDAKHQGFMKGNWSEQQLNRIAANLLGILEEFGMVSSHSKGNRSINSFSLFDTTILYLMHELHFLGHSDNSIIDHIDWTLFGLQPYQVFKEIERISYSGHFILQGNYSLAKINWKYKTMEDFINGIT